ncbi:MAG: N-methyl-L-tryptophan oxidase [Candidatus Obscuribacterales bacterium]|nr:N-methyl-L-tryptophan oxidase [Candidatus Obscuribacterales bacterium]
MVESTEYIVLGAGAVGSAAAYYLGREGKATTLVEQFELGHERGSSHGESRIIRYVYEMPVYVRMAAEAYLLWSELEQEACEKLYLKTGGLDLALASSPELVACRDSLKISGISFELMESAEISRRFPQFVVEPGSLGLYQEDSGILPASLSVETLQKLCRQHDVEIKTAWTVESIELEGGKVTIKGPSGILQGKHLVICAGSWSGPLLSRLGLNLPLVVSQEQYAFFAAKNANAFLPGKFPVFIQRSNSTAAGGIGWYGFPLFGRDGVKSAMHQTGVITTAQDRDFKVEKERLAMLQERMEALLPEAAGPILHSATCLYTNTPDQNFVIDHLPGYDNVVFFAGCSGHAFKFAPWIGKSLADRLQNKCQKDPEAEALFSASRFI